MDNPLWSDVLRVADFSDPAFAEWVAGFDGEWGAGVYVTDHATLLEKLQAEARAEAAGHWTNHFFPTHTAIKLCSNHHHGIAPRGDRRASLYDEGVFWEAKVFMPPGDYRNLTYLLAVSNVIRAITWKKYGNARSLRGWCDADAEDIFAAGMAKAFEALPKAINAAKPAAYLIKASIRGMDEWMEWRGRSHTTVDFQKVQRASRDESELAQKMIDREGDPAKIVELADEQEFIRELIRRACKDVREIRMMDLHLDEPLITQDEIGRQVGVTREYVAKRTRAILKQVAELIGLRPEEVGRKARAA